MLTFDVGKSSDRGVVTPSGGGIGVFPSVVPDRFSSTSVPTNGPIVRRELVSTTGERVPSSDNSFVPASEPSCR
jgi:hypothetical protein